MKNKDFMWLTDEFMLYRHPHQSSKNVPVCHN